MIKEAIGVGNTTDEAREKAIEALGAAEDADINFEVISTYKKKVLGLFGGCQAQVRAYIEVPDEKPKKANRPPKKENKKVADKSAEKETKKETVHEQKPTEPAESVKAPKEEHPSIEEELKNAVLAEELEPDSRAAKAVAYLKNILEHLGCNDMTFKVVPRQNGALISIEGDGLGTVIGRRGETLDALQDLTGLSAHNGGGYFKVSLNIGNYRAKREQTLTALAKRVSEQVLRTGRSRMLEPMNPYERRIIHTAVQEIDGVVSNSIGEGPGRRIVIAPEGGDSRPPRREDEFRGHGGHGRGGHGHSGRNGRKGDRRPSSTVSTEPSREPKKDSEIPLYGKIN